MNDTSGTPPVPQSRLRTFGTLALLGPNDETVLGKHGHHRRRLALLAALAAADEQGRSRDQLLLLFWPDVEQSRARHSLEQLLYALRGSIGETAFAGTNPLRLNPAVISSDVAVFSAALRRGDLESAVEAYRGPFLDGFYVGDAPEFERWVETERARLTTAYADAVHRLANGADASLDRDAAVRWWRKLVETDSVSSKYATGLVRALMNAGDYPAALRYAERYEAIVKEELGADVSPGAAALVAEVRAAAKTERVAPVRSLAPSVDVPVNESSVASGAPMPAASIAHAEANALPQKLRRRRPMVYATAALLLTVAVTATATRLRDSAASARPVDAAPSIAVLPFATPSGGGETSAIADGISEEMITALYRVPNLRVIARQSAFAFRDSDLDARTIGDSLKVMTLLQGSIEREGTRLRVNARLIDARDGSTRWSDTYVRELTEIFTVQREIAASVARELRLRVDSGDTRRLERPSTQNVAAWELMVRGRDPVHMRSPTDSGPRRGLAFLQQAVAIDSNFAAAYAAMPYMYMSLASRARTTEQVREFNRLSIEAANKAISLDPSLPAAYTGLGVALASGQMELQKAEDAFRRSIALGGSPRVREHLARVLMRSGRHQEALAHALRAEEEDPVSASAIADVGELLCANGRTDEGLAQLARLRDLKPPLQRVTGYIALCYGMQGKWREAIGAFGDSEIGMDPLSPMLGYVLARAGDTTRVNLLRKAAIERWQRTGRGAHVVAYIAAGFDDYDQVFEWLSRSDDVMATTSLMYPLFKGVQADPRYEQHRARLGLQKR